MQESIKTHNKFLFIITAGIFSLLLIITFAFQKSKSYFSSINSPPSVQAQAITPTPPRIYWGATINGSTVGSTCGDAPWCIDGKDQNGNAANDSVTIFESHTGKKMSLFNWGASWYRSTTWPYNNYVPFQTALFDKLQQRGTLSVFSWSPADGDVGSRTDQPNFNLNKIINGSRYGANCDITVTPTCKTYDAFLTEWATAAKTWGHPLFLRFAWEMNGNWFMWSENRSGNKSGEYIQAWRHVHDIFAQVGATNVTWVWCPNTEFSGSTAYEGLYPGDAYVDWTCLDGYNNGTDPGKPDVWKTFSQVFSSSYNHIVQIAPSKPMMIAETGSSEYGGSKAAWITDMLSSQLPNNFPNMQAFLWFDWNFQETNGVVKWAIESSATAQSAFAQGIASSVYSANDFGTLPPLQPIQPINGPLPSGQPTATPQATATPVPVTGANYLQNASFENTGTSWLSPWSFSVNSLAGASIAQDGSGPAVGTYSARVNVTQTNATIWYVQLKQNNMPTTAGQPVGIKFWAKASVPRSIGVVVQKNASPYTEYFNQSVNLTTSWQQYTLSFTPSVTDANLLTFNMANALGQVWIDGAEYITNGLSASATPIPTNTPLPTATPIPPTPTKTPIPTVTLTPTRTPTPTLVPDTTLPVVNITSPTNNSTVKKNSTVTISATATDNKAVTKVIFYVNGLQKCVDTTSSYSCAWQVPNGSGISYTISAQAYDAAGNIGKHQIQVKSK